MSIAEKQEQREKDLARLREWYPEGSTVYTILRHKSQSGMQRVIGLVALIVGEDGQIIDLHPNYLAGRVLDRRVDGQRDGVVCRGTGMDMGFDLVYSLSLAIHDNGYALKHRWL